VGRYVCRRLLGTLPVALAVSLIAFLVVNVLPGDPVQAMFGPGESVAPEVLAALRTSLGLDRSLPERYALWLGRLVRGDLGVSVRTGQPVLELIGQRVPPTLALALASCGLALAVALPVGTLSALRRRGAAQRAVDLVTLTGLSVPTFAVGITLIYLFAVRLGLLPAVGYADLGRDPAAFLRHLCLPALTQGAQLAAVLTLTVRHHVAEELARDYVRTAHAKGLPGRSVLLRHALRNAAMGIVSVGGWLLLSQAGGVVVVETLFAWPGLGQLVFRSVLGRDLPVIQGIALLTACLFLLLNLGLDLAYARLDPRVRLGARGGAPA
jgi:peptide/nickel transport system permease protein